MRSADGSLQFQHRFVGGQKQAVADAVRQELDLRSGLTPVRLKEQRQRDRRRRKRLMGARLEPAGFGGMYRGPKIKHDARSGEHGRRQKRRLHPVSCLACPFR